MASPEGSSSRGNDNGVRFMATFDAKLQCYSAKYTFLLSYFLSNVVLFFFAGVEEHHKWQNDTFLAWITPLARGTGNILNFNIALSFLLASKKMTAVLRDTVLSTVLPIDQAMPELHSLVGYVSIISSVLHGAFHFIAGIGRNRWESGFGRWTWCFITGFILFALFSGITATAIRPMRHRNFEIFINVHLFGALLFVPLLCLHGFHNGKLLTYKWIAGPALIYFVDRVLRKMSENRVTVRIRLDSKQQNLIYGEDIVRLSFSKPFGYRAGQYAEICVPGLSKTQWHPFTFASAPHEDEVVFFIKRSGDWTESLYELCKLGIDPKSGGRVLFIDVKIRGPYGAPAQHVGQYDRILLVSGGVGATPFCSITKQIHETISRQCTITTRLQRARTDSSLSTVELSEENRSRTEYSVDLGDERPNISEVGVTFEIDGMHRLKRPLPGPHAEFFRRPTLGRKHGQQDVSSVPTQTWTQFFHTLSSTTTYNTLMLWLLLVRYSVNLLGIAFHEVDLTARGTMIFQSRAMTGMDLVLSTLSLCLLLFAVFMEQVAEKRLCIEDVLLLIPLSCVPVIVHSLALQSVGLNSGYFAQHLFYVAWLLLLIVNLTRYFRVLGRRALLADTVRRSHQTTKSVDFIWTTPTSEADSWLIEELSRTVGRSKFVRLHRFITREQAPDVETGKNHVHAGRQLDGMFQEREQICRDHYGRPQWQQIFERFTSKMQNGTTAGIFFCGPSAMSAAVRQAAMHSMLDSRYRGLTNNVKSIEDYGIETLLFAQNKSEASLSDSLTRSFNVRYVFREEKF